MTCAPSPSVTMTSGSELPAGKDWASRSAAAIASGLRRNWSDVDSPMRIWVTPDARAARTRQVATTKAPGRAATRSPMRRHTDRESVRLVWPTRGTSGQKTHRPNSTRTAGSTTKAYPAATTMPTALASPKPLVDGNAESSRVSTASTTVVALTRTASPVRRRAWRIAAYRSGCVRSSSRYREMSSSA